MLVPTPAILCVTGHGSRKGPGARQLLFSLVALQSWLLFLTFPQAQFVRVPEDNVDYLFSLRMQTSITSAFSSCSVLRTVHDREARVDPHGPGGMVPREWWHWCCQVWVSERPGTRSSPRALQWPWWDISGPAGFCACPRPAGLAPPFQSFCSSGLSSPRSPGAHTSSCLPLPRVPGAPSSWPWPCVVAATAQARSEQMDTMLGVDYTLETSLSLGTGLLLSGWGLEKTSLALLPPRHGIHPYLPTDS